MALSNYITFQISKIYCPFFCSVIRTELSIRLFPISQKGRMKHLDHASADKKRLCEPTSWGLSPSALSPLEPPITI